mgnify:CR=1 FL=1
MYIQNQGSFRSPDLLIFTIMRTQSSRIAEKMVARKRTKKDFARMKKKQYLCTVKRRMPKIHKRVGATNNSIL